MNISRRDLLRTGAAFGGVLPFAGITFEGESTAGNDAEVEAVRLFANENPYGFSPLAKKMLGNSIEYANQYSERNWVSDLEKRIAEREGLKPENVVIGSGSGEVLCMAGAAYGQNGGEIVTPFPTFSLLSRYASRFGAKIVNIDLDSQYRLDLESMAGAIGRRTSLCYVCNPNNPTSTILPAGKVRNFCESVSKKTTVFADEAYLEYTADYPRNSMVGLVRKGYPVIVTRTFSKIYGMAGLRIGYGLAPKQIADRLKEFRMTWFNSLGIRAAIVSYKDTDFINMSRSRNRKVRAALVNELVRTGFEMAEPEGNFVWLRVGKKLSNLSERMAPYGIRVRNAGDPFSEWARITVGTENQMDKFISGMKSSRA